MYRGNQSVPGLKPPKYKLQRGSEEERRKNEEKEDEMANNEAVEMYLEDAESK